MKVKEESEKVSLKLNIQKMKIMASGPITLWEIDGETGETVADFIFWAPKSLQMLIEALKVKDETKKGGFKLNIQKTKIMTSGPITSWQTDGGKL